MNELREFKERIIEECPTLKKIKENDYIITKEDLHAFIDVLNLDEKGWIKLIQALCIPDARYVVEIYRGFLKWLIDTEKIKINTETYNGQCITLWSNAPEIKWNKLSQIEILRYGKLLNTSFHGLIPNADQNTLYKSEYKDSKFAPCPYCTVEDSCHFCEKKNLNSRFCIPEAGIHCCKDHGLQYLSSTKSSSIHSMNYQQAVTTKHGRKIFNIRKILYFKDYITDFGDKPLEHIEKYKISKIKQSINLYNQLDYIKEKNEKKTKIIPINFTQHITAANNEW